MVGGKAGRITKGLGELFSSGGHVHYLDCSHGFMGYIYVSKLRFIYFKYVQLLYVNYTLIKLFKN